MPQSQSKKPPKPFGTCSHCLATRRLHSGGSLVHLHGHREEPCEGSNCPPLEHTARSGGDTGPLLDPAPVCGSSADYVSVNHPETNGPLLRHICKGARPACSQALTSTLNAICKTPNSIEIWTALLDFAPSLLAKPA